MITSVLCAKAFLLLFTLHSATLGFALGGRLGLWRGECCERSNVYLGAFFALAGGIAANITLMFLLGVAAWLTPVNVLGVRAAVFFAAVATLVRDGASARTLHAPSQWGLGGATDSLVLADIAAMALL